MSYALKVKENANIPAVTHADGTARLQTVTKDDNTLLYDLLTEFNGVLLNTSLNIRGKPMTNKIIVALEMLKSQKGGLDYLVVYHKGKIYIHS